MKKKLLVGILVLTMLAACLGVSALAAAASGATYQEGHDWAKAAASNSDAYTIDEATGKVTLTEDLELDTFVYLTSGSVTVDLAGHNLSRSGNAGTVIAASGTGKLTLTNSGTEGQISGKDAFIVSQKGGTITFNNVKIEQTEQTDQPMKDCAIYAQEGGSVVIEAGTEIIAKAGIMVSDKGTNSLTMTGGKITAEDSAIYTNGSSNKAEDYDDTQTITISGGTIESIKGTAIYLPGKGAIVTISEDDGTTTITGAVTGIEIRSGSLTVDAGTITGGKDEAETGETPSVGGAVTKNAGIGVAPYADQEISVTVTGGKISGGTAFYQSTPDDGSGATYEVELDGGEFDGTHAAVSVDDDELKTENFVYGGTFTVTAEGETKGDTTVNEYLADQSQKIDATTGAPTARTEDDEDNVVSVTIDGTTTYYSDVRSALVAAHGETATVKLLKNGEISKDFTISSKTSDITLDLNNKTLTLKDDTQISITINGNKLTVTDSSDEKGGKITNEESSESPIIYVRTGATLAVENGTIEDKSTNSGNSAIAVYGKNATVEINGGKVTGGYYGVTVQGSAALNVTGGEIASTNAAAVSGHAAEDGTTITISGGKLTSEKSAAIYQPQEGDLTITGDAEISGKIGVLNRAGTVTVEADEDGNVPTIKSTATGAEDTVTLGSGDAVPPAAFVEDYNDGYVGETTGATITGGNFEAENEGVGTVVYTEKGKEASTTEPSVSVSGGTFKSGSTGDKEVGKYLDPASTVNTTTGSVAPREAMDADANFRVGEKYYADLQAAIDEASKLSTAEKEAVEVTVTVLKKNVPIDDVVTVKEGKIKLVGTFATCGINYPKDTAKDKHCIYVEGGTLTLENITITGTDESKPEDNLNPPAIMVKGGELIVNDGTTITNNDSAIGAIQEGKVTINGGTITSNQEMAVAANGSSGNKPTVTINGGTIKGADTACGVYVPSGTLTVTGGDISGGAGIVVRGSGVATVKSGTVTATATGKVKAGDSTTELEPAAVVVDASTVDGEAATLEDGTFKAQSGTTPVTGNKLVVNGGTYSAHVDHKNLNPDFNFEAKSADGYSYHETREEAVDAAGTDGTVTMFHVPMTVSTFYATKAEADEALGVTDAANNTFHIQFSEAPNPEEGIWIEVTKGAKTIGIAGSGDLTKIYFSLDAKDHFEYWPTGTEVKDFAGDVTVKVYATKTVLAKNGNGESKPTDAESLADAEPIAEYTVNTLRIVNSGYIASKADVANQAPEGATHDDWGDQTMWVEFNLPVPAGDQVIIKYTAANGAVGYIACKVTDGDHKFFAWSFKNETQTPGIDAVAGDYAFTTYYDKDAKISEEADLTEDMVIETEVAGPEVTPPAGLTVNSIDVGYGHTKKLADAAIADVYPGTLTDVAGKTMFAVLNFEVEAGKTVNANELTFRFTCGNNTYTEKIGSQITSENHYAIIYFSFDNEEQVQQTEFDAGEYTVDVLRDGIVIASEKLTLYRVAVDGDDTYDVSDLTSKVDGLLATSEEEAETLAELPSTLKTTGTEPVEESVDWTAAVNDETHTITFTASKHTVTPSGGASATTSKVTKPENGSVELSSTTARGGQTVTVTATPDEGYDVGDVIVKDRNGNPVEVTRNDDGTYSYTVPAGKTPVTVEVVFDECLCDDFADLDLTEWYHEAIDYAIKNQLMLGQGDGFAPSAPVRRAEIAVILGRMEGKDFETGGEHWYDESLAWAQEEGITDGSDPLRDCKREEVVTMLWRYMDKPESDADLSAYVDADQVDDWALDAMKWAVENEIIRGYDNNDLQPTGPLSRAEFATILERIGATVSDTADTAE